MFEITISWVKLRESAYSSLPIKRAGSNKRAGWNFSEISLNEQAVINEQAGFFSEISLNEQAVINEQVGIFWLF